MEQPALGLKISTLRKQKGLTQEELVEQCNINVRTLQRIENGEVSPRSYTVKTILSALDYDLESLQEEKQDAIRLNIGSPSERTSIHRLLTMAWISGIFFFIAAIFEGIIDYSRFEDGTYVFGKWGHVSIKAAVMIFNGVLLYGFLIAGNLLKNHLMKIASILLFFVLICFYSFDIASVFNANITTDIVFLAGAISFGIVGLVFGISILQSRKVLGNTALILGILEIILASFLLLVILAPFSFFILLPVIILECVFMYKLASLVKNQA